MDRVRRRAEARPGSRIATSRPATSTSTPNIRYANNQPPKLNGYTASNQLTIRFRDIANSGKILDALVAEGANQINGPSLTIDKPEAALDEARARGDRRRAGARGPLCAVARAARRPRGVGQRKRRLCRAAADADDDAGAAPQAADTKIEPGEQKLRSTLSDDVRASVEHRKRPRGDRPRGLRFEMRLNAA